MGLGSLVAGFASRPKDMPLPKTYGEVGNQNIDMQEGWQQNYLDAESKWRPQWQGLNESTLGGQLFGGNGNAGYLGMLQQTKNQSMGMQEDFGGAQLGMMQRLQGNARNAYMTPLMQATQGQMYNQGMQYASGQLSAGDRFMATQNANRQIGLQGLSGRQAVGANVLGNYGMSQDRMMMGQKMLQNVYNNEAGAADNIAGLTLSGQKQMGYSAGLYGDAGKALGQYNTGIFNPESERGFSQDAARYKADISNRLAQQQWKAGMWKEAGGMIDDGISYASGGFA
jgi:hypothetical protein